MKLINNPDRSQWAEILKRPVMNTENLFDTVREIIDRVKSDGDRAVLEMEANSGSAALSFSFGIFSFVSRQKKSTSQYHFFNRQHQNSFCPQRLQLSYNLPEALFIQHRMY